MLFLLIIYLDDTANECIRIKIYDFQLYSYQSFAFDLMLFLFSSVRSIDLAKNFHMFINRYHKEFVETMESVGFMSNEYSFGRIWHEIQVKAKLELLHILFVAKISLANRTTEPSIDEISLNTIFNEQSPSEAVLRRWKFLIDIFAENGLI